MIDKISISDVVEAHKRGGFRYECPECGNIFGPVVGDDSKVVEEGKAGSHTFCVRCQADLVIMKKGKLRRATADEMVAFFEEDPDGYMLFQQLKSALRGDPKAKDKLRAMIKP